MDIAALQASLRRFAAERDWQPFHTPKNLAMALVVEAAELVEVYQWLTPEQSLAARDDAVTRERVGDEVADVLLYLLQIADHGGVDLDSAVQRKLAKNARKHPPLRPGLPAGPAIQARAATHVLLDYENVQPTEAELRLLVPDMTDLWLFHGLHQKNLAQRYPSLGERLTLIQIEQRGKNALDFHLSFYLGYVAARNPDAHLVVVANDRGYEPMLVHAKALGFATRQLGHVNAPRTTPRRGTHSAKSAARPVAAGAPAGAAPEAGAAPGARSRPGTAAATKKAARVPAKAATKAGPKTPGTTAQQTPQSAQPVAPRKAARKTPPDATGKVGAKAAAGKPAGNAAAKPPAKSHAKRAAKAPADARAAEPAMPAPTAAATSRAKASSAGAPAKRAAARRAPAAQAAPAAPTPTPAAAGVGQRPEAAARVADALGKMGVRRPRKLTSLRRHLASFLGVPVDDAQAQSALVALVDAGVLSVGANGDVRYRS